MILIGILQCLLYLGLVPFATGLAFTRHFDEKYNTLGNIFLSGFMSELAVFEVLFLIFYKLDLRMSQLTWCAAIILIVMAAVSFIFNFKTCKNIKLPKLDMGFGVFVLFTIYMVVMRNLQGVNDGDDAFVLGNALTTLTTDYFYKTDYYTGFALNGDNFMRHLLSANPIFIAFIAKVTFIHPTILAHRVLGSFYLILHNALIYNIACILFEEENKKYYRGIFASLVSLLTIWDFHSYLTDSTFVLSRTWQGKAMFCAFAVPMAVLLLLLIGKSEGKKNIYFMLTAVLCVASVLMTPAAIYMLSLLLISGVIAVSLTTKKFAVCLKTVPALIPMAGFLAVYIIYIH